MRKLISFLLAAALLTLPALAAEPLAEESLSLRCTAAVLMEGQTGTVLYAKGEHEHLSPASVTKVMTLLLLAEAVDAGILSPEETVTASRRASSMGGSQIWLREGEEMTVSDMVKCVAVVSANDCAVALAEHLCGSEEAFVERMNARAAELGLTDTHFTNCTGLFEDPAHYTSAYDIAVMARALLSHEYIRQFTTIWTDTIRNGEFGLTNTNRLVRSYPGCTGLKTGFTSKAMFCLAGSAEREGVEYIAVVLHADTSEDRFDAVRTLLDSGFANFELYTPGSESLPASLPVTLGTAECVPLVPGSGTAAVLRKGQSSTLTETLLLPESVPAPVEEGQVLGTLRLCCGGETVAELPLLAGEAVARLSLGQIWLRLVQRCTEGLTLRGNPEEDPSRA